MASLAAGKHEAAGGGGTAPAAPAGSNWAALKQVNMHGNTLYDTHVAVKEQVTDYRTFVSGVHWYDLKGAPSFEAVQAKVAAILKGRILVGHTLKSDMSALLLSHPARDTRDLALYAPLQRCGQSGSGNGGARKGLRVLAAEVLGLEIQTGEHSPVEDARASMYVYLRYRKRWEKELRGVTTHAGGRAKKRG